jgi:hypothetical protein
VAGLNEIVQALVDQYGLSEVCDALQVTEQGEAETAAVAELLHAMIHAPLPTCQQNYHWGDMIIKPKGDHAS